MNAKEGILSQQLLSALKIENGPLQEAGQRTHLPS